MIVDRFLKLERKFVFYLPQDSCRPATQRSDDTHSEASRNRGDPTKTKNKNKNKDNNQATSNRLRDLPEWLEEFTENLEDTEVPAARDVLQTLLKILIRNVLLKWYQGSTAPTLKSRKTEIAKSARGVRLHGLLAGSALVKQ